MKSLWINSVLNTNYPTLDKILTTDVCIIGGGLTGVTTAYLLCKKGYNVCLLEKDKIAHKTSGNTTGKITSSHGLFYNYLINSFSKEIAKGYLCANEAAIKNIKQIIDLEHIDCDFEYQDNFIYTINDNEVQNIKDEFEATSSLGFKAEHVNSIPYPIETKAAIKFPNQAQFNPLKYIHALCNSISDNFGLIFENTKVFDVEAQDNFYITKTQNGLIKSKYVVLACGYPIINLNGFYFLKLYQEASYIIAVDTKCDLPTRYVH